MKKQFLCMMFFVSLISGLAAQNVADTLYRVRQKIQAPISKIEVSGGVVLNILPASQVSEVQVESSKALTTFVNDSLSLKYGIYTSDLSLKGGVLNIRKSIQSDTMIYTLFLSDRHVRMEVADDAEVYIAGDAVSHIERIYAGDLSLVVLNGKYSSSPFSSQMVDVCRDTLRTSYLQLMVKDMAKVQLKGAAWFGKLEVYQEDHSHFSIEDIVLGNHETPDGIRHYIGCPLTMDELDMKLSDFSEADVSLPLTVGNHRLSLEDASVYRLNVDVYHSDSLFIRQSDASLIVQGKDTALVKSGLSNDFFKELCKRIPQLDSLMKYGADTTLSEEERKAKLDSFKLEKSIRVDFSKDTMKFKSKPVLMKQNKWADYLFYDRGGVSSMWSVDGKVVLNTASRTETGNNESELAELDSLGNILKEAIRSLKEKHRKGHYWSGDWALYWGFMGSPYDMNVLPSALHFPNTPYDVHISFSSPSLEYQKKYHFNSRHALGLGLAISWDNYRYNTPDSLPDFIKAQGMIPQDFRKGKFVARYVTVPLSYTYSRRKSFSIGLDVLPGYMFKANEKIVWENHGEKQVQKNRNYSDVMPFKLDARLTLGWKWGAIYFQPSLLPVIKSGDNWDVVPMRIGLRFF